MRAYSLQRQVLARGEHFAEMRPRCLRRSQAVHARVELQVNGQNTLPLARRSFERLNVPGLPDRRSKIFGDDTAFLALPDPGHQQNASLATGAAQCEAFGGIGYSQPLRAFGFKRAGALHRAVTITVSLDHAANGYVADVFLHGVEIFS